MDQETLDCSSLTNGLEFEFNICCSMRVFFVYNDDFIQLSLPPMENTFGSSNIFVTYVAVFPKGVFHNEIEIIL